ncbi:MAG: DUF3300 domain-containing protein [Methylacidiphilales bacterium]|nr:DUF3300 domain-containing protein [Candidatus Methylacidiphilales bacterium]
MPAYQPLSDAQLDQLLGPIALYPDPLIAEILPASTFPTQIVLADRYVTGGGDPSQFGQQPWDPTVQAMARYPTVLKWMDDNLGETTELGQAFLNQQPAVMASIQRLRAEASKLGNLQSTPQQQVTDDGGDIEIDPADADEMYVPDYQPDQVYYDSADGTPFITFGIGFPIGLWLDNDCDWGNGNIIVWNSGNPRPSNWWHQSGGQRNTGNTTVWRAGNHSAAAVTNHVDRGWGNSAPTPAAARADSAFTGTESTATSHNSAATSHDSATTSHDSTATSHDSAFTGTEPTHQATQHDESSSSVSHSATVPAEHTAPISRPEADDALIGVQSTHDTQTYSDRGQQSIHATTQSAPASHSAPAASHSSGGGGGGGHSGGGGGGGGGSHASGGGGGGNNKPK